MEDTDKLKISRVKLLQQIVIHFEDEDEISVTISKTGFTSPKLYFVRTETPHDHVGASGDYLTAAQIRSKFDLKLDAKILQAFDFDLFTLINEN